MISGVTNICREYDMQLLYALFFGCKVVGN